MGSWTSRVARTCALHPKRVVLIWAVVFVASIVSIGGLLGSALTTEGNITTNVESKAGFDLLDKRLPDGNPLGGDVVVVRSQTLTVTAPAYERFIGQLAADILATGKVTSVTTTYT